MVRLVQATCLYSKVYITPLLANMKPISTLIHVSDTHFRNGQDWFVPTISIIDEFFNSLLTQGFDPSTTLIVVTGDVLHTKTTLSASGFQLLLHFFTSHPEFPMFVIPGNHDFNQVDSTQTGFLESLLTTSQFDHVFFTSKTGVYNYRNVQFGVLGLTDVFTPGSSCLQDVSVPFPPVRRSPDITHYIGLSHLPLDTFHSDLKSNVVLTSDHPLFLLGDIHQAGIHRTKTGFYVYAGSLYQVSSNEDPFDHGYYSVSLDPSGGCEVRRHVIPPHVLRLRFDDSFADKMRAHNVPQDAFITLLGCPVSEQDGVRKMFPRTTFVGCHLRDLVVQDAPAPSNVMAIRTPANDF